MGLCKCPKKRVTNLFCFVHKVNVCEDCMIIQHPRCIVHSYIQWLQDSDYEPVCLLCAKSLNEGDVIRLCCHDLFHLSCLDNYVQSRPNSLSLSSLKCPRCKDMLFPSTNMVSPVAEQLRQSLKGFWWGREGLGLTQEDISLEDDEILTTTLTENRVSPSLLDSNHMTSTPMAHSRVSHETISHDSHVTLQIYDQPINRGTTEEETMSIPYHTINSNNYAKPVQEDDKYKKKNPFNAAKRWLKNKQPWVTMTAEDTSITIKRYLIVILLVVGGMVTLIILMTRVSGRSIATSDTDWKHNIHVRTGQ